MVKAKALLSFGYFFHHVDNPEEVLGINSNMMFSRLPDTYEKLCLIEYLHYLRIHTSPLVKPEWVNKLVE